MLSGAGFGSVVVLAVVLAVALADALVSSAANDVAAMAVAHTATAEAKAIREERIGETSR